MTAVAKKADTGPKLMTGSSGAKDYLVIARQSDVALGIKPNIVMSGRAFGHPDTVWFGARLRSAPAGDLFQDEDTGNVVKLEKKPENLWDCWPNVVWEKKDHTRASTEIGVLLRGRFDGTVAEAKQLLNELKDGKLSNKLADYLYDLVGEQHMILTKAEIAAWLTENVYAKIAQNIEESIKRKVAFEEEMGKTIGVFGMQAQILKKAYEQAKAEAAEAEDLDEDDEIEDEDDDTDQD